MTKKDPKFNIGDRVYHMHNYCVHELKIKQILVTENGIFYTACDKSPYYDSDKNFIEEIFLHPCRDTLRDEVVEGVQEEIEYAKENCPEKILELKDRILHVKTTPLRYTSKTQQVENKKPLFR